MTGSDARLDAYLARLEAELAPLPAQERREILLETRSHLLERTAGAPTGSGDAVLAELGSPEAYARQFLPHADEPERPAGAPATIARLATGPWTGLPVLFVVMVAYGIAAGTFLLGVWKLVEPRATGLFVSHAGGGRSVMLVVSDPRAAEGRDVLGYWFVPIAILISVSIHLAMSALLRRVHRHRAGGG